MANFYYKVTFVSCCDQTAVELQILTSQINGGLYLTQGGTYLYNGVTGDLISGQCYTYTVDTSVNVNGFNAAPPVTDFNGLEVSCQDQVCQNCAPTITYYTLNDCCTNEPLFFQGEVLVIEFDGQPALGNIYPEDIEDLIITNIGFELIDFQGCFKLTSTDPADEFFRFEIIEQLTTTETCEECQICPVYYTLNDCCTGDPFLSNGETIYLRYDGACIPNYCPEDILPKIITTFGPEGGGELFSGCYQLTEVPTPPPGSVETNYINLINEITITVPTCEECQACPVYYTLNDCCTLEPVEYDGEVIYLRYNIGDCPAPGTCPEDIGSSIITTIANEVEINLSGCLQLTEIAELPPGAVTSGYPSIMQEITTVPTCKDCKPVYKLTNCVLEGVPPIFVSNDLSQYVDKSIYLCPENFPSNPTPPTDPGIPFIVPDDTPQYKGTLTNCCDPTDKRYISNNFLSFPTTGSIVIPNIDSPSGGSTTCWTYQKGDIVGQTYIFANLTGAIFYENCILCNQQNPCVVYPIVEECYCYLVESVDCEETITLTLPLVIEEYDDCLTCRSQKEPKCYLLVDCADNDNTIIVNNDFEDYVGKVIQIKYCDIYWSVFEAPTCLNSITVADFAEEFDTCPGAPPEPELTLKPRAITPGYKTPACTPEYTEKVNCSFANQAFDKMASIRYGINSCCEEDFDYWDVKKRLLELDEIKDNFIIK